MSQLAPAPPPPPVATEPLLPPLAVAAGIACIAGAALLFDCALIAASLKKARNGLFSIIIQLAIADIILIGASIVPELWSCNARTWYFGSSGCMAYHGLSVFASSASLYFVLTIALHTIATINLEKKSAHRKVPSIDRDEDEEMRSSRHSLVASSDTSTPPRTMNVDYRLAERRVPITAPSVFVWILSTSLSVPEFAFATTARLEDVVLCGLELSNHRLNIHSMLIVFNLFIPVIIMSAASTVIIIKLKSTKKLVNESVAALKLSLSLIGLYGLLCAPRSIAIVYSIYSTTEREISPTGQQEQSNTITAINLALSGAYLIAALLRPVLCIVVLPRLRKVFSHNIRKVDV